MKLNVLCVGFHCSCIISILNKTMAWTKVLLTSMYYRVCTVGSSPVLKILFLVFLLFLVTLLLSCFVLFYCDCLPHPDYFSPADPVFPGPLCNWVETCFSLLPTHICDNYLILYLWNDKKKPSLLNRNALFRSHILRLAFRGGINQEKFYCLP